MTDNRANDIQTRINLRVEKLLRKGEDGKYKPYVCTICDHLLHGTEICEVSKKVLERSKDLLTPQDWNDVGNESLEQEYKYPEDDDGYEDFMEDMLLSPRGSLRRHEHYTACASCRTALQRQQLPEHAIANNNFVGETPKVLDELTPVELAFLCPTKTHGYCFTWKGGKSTNLSGSLGYYRIKTEKISQATGQLWSLGAKIVILIHGKMTAKQRAKAKENSTIRVEKVVEALRWLSENHVDGEQFNVDKWKEKYDKNEPIVIDKSSEEDGSDNAEEANVEVTEKFCVYYPDGTANEYTGGHASQKDFREIVQKAKENGYDLEWQNKFERELVSDVTKNEAFLLGNLLQFPYGRGGFNEDRDNELRGISDHVDTDTFIRHLSCMSLPQFHRPLHSLMLYNLTFKSTMLRQACCVVENGDQAANMMKGLKADDVARAARAQANFTHGGSAVSRKYLQYVRTVAGSLPHSNEASGKGQMNMEAMCHNLGPPQTFLTVTYDDDNSFLVQALSGVDIDPIDVPISSVSDEELRERAKKRTELRLKFPGLAAFAFEEALDIVMKEVVGWDCEKHRSNGTGLFGKCIACTYAVEEQGRKTLHVHILIWTEQLRDLFASLNSDIISVRTQARTDIAKLFDKVASTELFKTDAETKAKILRATDHKCEVRIRKRKLPELVPEQELRNLRHIDGFAATKGKYVECPHCTEESAIFTNEELIEQYLIKGEEVPGLTAYPEPATRRLKAMYLQHQCPEATSELSPTVIRAAYNNHISCHTDSCFRCKKKKRKTDHPNNTGDKTNTKGFLPTDVECRARFPAIPIPRKTVVEETEDREVYSFNGSSKRMPFFVLKPKRNRFDCFQNVSCFPISESKLGTGNTNVNFLFPGPFLPYTCKYQMKKTQSDDQAEFKSVVGDMRKMLEGGRKHESDRSEVMRMVIRSTYKHNSSNIVGAPMASFLTRSRTRSRFYLSHESVWLPLRDMRDTLNGKEPSARVKYRGRMKIIEFQCRHYLCRHRSLEKLSFFDFTSKYEVSFMPRIERENCDVLPFTNTPDYEHPSYINNRMRQGVKEREEPKLIKVFQGMFPDSAQFDGNIFDMSVQTNDKMEEYAFLVLMLFMPFRSLKDFSSPSHNNVDYRAKLVDVLNTGYILKPHHMKFLQNIQDIKHNYLRYGRIPDDLESRTELFQSDNAGASRGDDDDSDDEETENDAELLDAIMEEAQDDEKDDSQIPYPSKVSFKNIRYRGKGRNVENDICDLGDRGEPSNEILERFLKIPSPTTNAAPVPDTNAQTSSSRTPTKRTTQDDIVRVMAVKRHVRIPLSTKQKEMRALEANGTSESIIDWCRKAKLDTRQSRAFSLLTAQFVLTYYDESYSEEAESRMGRRRYIEERRRLRRLVCLHKSSSSFSRKTLMFLHGPGGSGKSTVLNLVLTYAKAFCDHLDQPFTKNTIIVSAMSGVAATLLHGRTTHSSCCLCRKPTTDDLNAWKECRMLIVDEISFAAQEDIETLDVKLRLLKDNMDRRYGGIHIVFAGDFRQLDPVGKDPLHETACKRFKDWVNCYIELDGTHRFSDDPEWGELLMRFRNGTVTIEDIRRINTKCLESREMDNHGQPIDLPPGIQYASYDNKTRDRINTAIFENYVETTLEETGRAPPDAVLIFMDELYRKDGRKKLIPIRSKQTFWENCGEDDIKTGRQKPRLDSVLKLFYRCPVMLTHNKDVASAEANGTCALVEQVILNPGETPFSVTLDSGAQVKGVLASQVDKVRLQHCDASLSPPQFDLEAETFNFRTKWPIPENLRTSPTREFETIRMQGRQVPCVVNHATTGHKLQGKSVDNIFVANWNYKGNWVYVVLSRVRTIDGLYLQKPLVLNVQKYSIARSYVTMMRNFAERCQADYFDEGDYDCIINDRPFGTV